MSNYNKKQCTIIIPPSITNQMTNITTNSFTTLPGDTYVTSVILEEKSKVLQKYKTDFYWFQYKDLLGANEGVLTIPYGTTIIEAYQYANLTNLTKIIIPDTVIAIQEGAFLGCTALHTIEFSNLDSVLYSLDIGNRAFENCHGLYQIILPKRLRNIGTNAFKGCYKLVEIVDQFEYFKTNDNILKPNVVLFENNIPTTNYGCIGYYLASIENIVTSLSDTYLVYENNLVYYIGSLRTYANLMHSISQKSETVDTSNGGYVKQNTDWKGTHLIKSIKIPNLRDDGAGIQWPRNNPDNKPKLSTDVLTLPMWQNMKFGLENQEDYMDLSLYNGNLQVYYIIHVEPDVDILNIKPQKQNNGIVCLYPYLAYKNVNISTLNLGEHIDFIFHQALADMTKVHTVNYECYNARTISLEIYWDNDETEYLNAAFSHLGSQTSGVTLSIADSVFGLDYYLFQPNHRSGKSSTALQLNLGFPKLLYVQGGNGLKIIHEHAFDSNLKLISFYMGTSLEIIETNAFQNCPILKELYNYSTIDLSKSNPGGIKTNVYKILDNIKETIYERVDDDYIFIIDLEKNHIELISYTGYPIALTLPRVRRNNQQYNYTIATNFLLNATNIISVILNDSITKIGDSAFKNTSISSITFYKNLQYLGKQAFASCKKLEKIDFDTDVELASIEVKDECFLSCSALKLIPPLHYFKNMQRGIFKSCEAASNEVIEFPNWNIFATDNGREVFQACKKIKAVKFGKGTHTIGSYCFNQCHGLTNIDFSNSDITTLANSAFDNCNAIETVILSPKMTAIGIGAFGFSGRLKTIKFINDNEANSNNYFSVDNGALYDKQKTILKQFFIGNTNINSFIIPNSVITLENLSFADETSHKSLTELILPSGLTSIGDQTFRYQQGLQQLIIPNSVARIGNNAFQSCSSGLKLYCLCNTIPTGWHQNWNSGISYYLYSENRPDSNIGKYWHYINDKPTIWS